MKTAFRASTFVWAGMVLGSLAAAPASAQDAGSIVAWGNNEVGQCNVPAPNSGFVAVAGGTWHSLGLKAFYGDLNCDGVVNFDDINAFVSALGADPLVWNLAHPRCHWLNADCNGDGHVDFDDIDPLVAILSGG
jgi:hypothetical protein